MLQQPQVRLVRVPDLAELLELEHALRRLQLLHDVQQVRVQQLLVLAVQALGRAQALVLQRADIEDGAEWLPTYSCASRYSFAVITRVSAFSLHSVLVLAARLSSVFSMPFHCCSIPIIQPNYYVKELIIHLLILMITSDIIIK